MKRIRYSEKGNKVEHTRYSDDDNTITLHVDSEGYLVLTFPSWVSKECFPLIAQHIADGKFTMDTYVEDFECMTATLNFTWRLQK